MLIRLFHSKALGYPPSNTRTTVSVPESILELANDGAMIVTFRPLKAGWPDRSVKNLTAVDRYLWLKADQLILYGIETDSPLAPLILWDIVHAADVGSTISLVGDSQAESYLQRSYFASSLEVLESTRDKKVFRKNAPLPVEADSGLDAWSFCIPVGPEDATLLNATVKRILELEIPKKEILLCGRPAANFEYFEHVRIVGEDITAPPVKICAKKNRLASEARFQNLCIIHDRVFLPRDFYEAVNKFGDFYPLTTFQSIFFDDKYNLIPRRYSDYNVSYRMKSSVNHGLMRDNDVTQPSPISPSVFPLSEGLQFYYANPLIYDSGSYPTGSLYISKRSVWAQYPQNENLYWTEFEDIEHAYRAADAGVPSRVNPFSLTQSLISRPIVVWVRGSFIEPAKGPPRLIRPWSEFLPISRKPAIKVSCDVAISGLHKFSEKYAPGADRVLIPASVAIRTSSRLETIVNILSRVQIPLHEKEVREFIKDFEKFVLLDQLPYSFIEHACHRFLVDRASPWQVLVVENDSFLNFIAKRPKKEMFYSSLSDFFQVRSLLLSIGTLISAIYLFVNRKKIIYIKGGPLCYLKALKNTTPYVN